MNRTLANTISVLIVTLFVALAVFGTVHLTGRVLGTSTATTATTGVLSTDVAAASSATGQVMVCPRTGCSATSCHAAQ